MRRLYCTRRRSRTRCAGSRHGARCRCRDVAVVVDARQAVCQGPRFQVALVVLRLGDGDGSAVLQGGKIGAGAGEDPHDLDARLGARPERLRAGGRADALPRRSSTRRRPRTLRVVTEPGLAGPAAGPELPDNTRGYVWPPLDDTRDANPKNPSWKNDSLRNTRRSDLGGPIELRGRSRHSCFCCIFGANGRKPRVCALFDEVIFYTSIESPKRSQKKSNRSGVQKACKPFFCNNKWVQWSALAGRGFILAQESMTKKKVQLTNLTSIS